MRSFQYLHVKNEQRTRRAEETAVRDADRCFWSYFLFRLCRKSLPSVFCYLYRFRATCRWLVCW